jgi:aminoglycoside N3'-acetyltransferase
MTFPELLDNIVIQSAHHILMHSAFRAVKHEFPGLQIKELIQGIQKIVAPRGSLIIPAFSYCFKHIDGLNELFQRESTSSKVGAVSEVFRNMPDVVRTASPTHSFALWGKVVHTYEWNLSPDSPLGEDSILGWLAQTRNSYVLLLGADFSTLSFGHYLEIVAEVPWVNIYPWNHLNVLPIGISVHGEQPLKEVPGCSEGFKAFENYLLKEDRIKPHRYNELNVYYLPVSLLLKEGIDYFRNYPDTLLCEPGTCASCDERWQNYLKGLKKNLKLG